MDQEFLMMCESLNNAVVEPLLRPEEREFALEQFGTIGLDILQRWNAEFKALKR